jgi:hypothetical protein
MTNTFFGFTPIPTNADQQGQVPTGAGAIGNVKRKSRSFSFDEDSNREVSSTPTFLSLLSLLGLDGILMIRLKVEECNHPHSNDAQRAHTPHNQS